MLVPLYGFAELIAVHYRHHHVAEYEVRLVLVDLVEGLLAVLSCPYVVVLSKFLPHEVKKVGAVIDNKYFRTVRAFCRFTVRAFCSVGFCLLLIRN